MLHLGFGTDGDLSQFFGIAGLLSALRRGAGALRHCPIWILAPERALAQALMFLRDETMDHETHGIVVNTDDDDPYYVQLGLSKLFNSIGPDDTALCLDYDHVVIDPPALSLPSIMGGVYVSSEFYTAASAQVFLSSAVSDPLPKDHCNISLLYGTGGDLSLVGSEWAGAYDDLRHCVGIRHRTELAFTLAAERVGVRLQPCATTLQSNFARNARSCGLFHYGGESEQAGALKRRLKALSKEPGACQTEGRPLAIHDALAQEIISLL